MPSSIRQPRSLKRDSRRRNQMIRLQRQMEIMVSRWLCQGLSTMPGFFWLTLWGIHASCRVSFDLNLLPYAPCPIFAYLMPKIYLGHQVLVHPYPNVQVGLPPIFHSSLTTDYNACIYSLQRWTVKCSLFTNYSPHNYLNIKYKSAWWTVWTVFPKKSFFLLFNSYEKWTRPPMCIAVCIAPFLDFIFINKII